MKLRSPMLKKVFSRKYECLLLLSLAGCSQTLTNVTPSVVQRNPSNMYRFTTRCNVPENKVIPDTFKLELVIDGEKYALKPESLTPGFYYYDHILGEDRLEAKYYFELNYQQNHHGRLKNYVAKTSLSTFKIQKCCCISLDCERAPVGAEVKILGRGFSTGDRIWVGEYNAVTTWDSQNVLSFQVPQVVTDRSYPVYYSVCNNEKVFVGNLWVDSNRFTIEPTSILLEKGETTEFTVSIASPLTYDLEVNVTTDIPDSVIMPEMKIGAGETSATVSIEGGEKGSGHLFVYAQGFAEQKVDIEVDSEDDLNEEDSDDESDDEDS